jgi:hypothetical protein
VGTLDSVSRAFSQVSLCAALRRDGGALAHAPRAGRRRPLRGRRSAHAALGGRARGPPKRPRLARARARAGAARRCRDARRGSGAPGAYAAFARLRFGAQGRPSKRGGPGCGRCRHGRAQGAAGCRRRRRCRGAAVHAARLRCHPVVDSLPSRRGEGGRARHGQPRRALRGRRALEGAPRIHRHRSRCALPWLGFMELI